MYSDLYFGLVMDMRALAEHNGTVARVLLLIAAFASGWFEAVVLKSKTLACTTWFICLGALTAWIAYAWTTVAMIAAGAVFASGVIALVVFYWSSKVDVRNSR
jgi:hypothetical protein